ncbi:hypothetical protein U472_09930 [Orenia metallireducens]|jgi:hypothetical protein|uniref:Uncharacterized protein n=1 Tax=Orenia metallireducens TaxID=1413210 RepID=A0A1C0A7X3_9FIRM|nr:hypothetical protein [Orenia metallireducens]OCL26318.1 hypothetical protein U472_09930 [Orenia metallireducens]
MSWEGTKTDWTPDDGVDNKNFNRIEGNIQDNHNRLNSLKNEMFFDVDGLTYINKSASNGSDFEIKTLTIDLGSPFLWYTSNMNYIESGAPFTYKDDEGSSTGMRNTILKYGKGTKEFDGQKVISFKIDNREVVNSYTNLPPLIVKDKIEIKVMLGSVYLGHGGNSGYSYYRFRDIYDEYQLINQLNQEYSSVNKCTFNIRGYVIKL